MSDDGLPSPCISICRFKNHKERICIGCGRSQKQIRSWMDYDIEKRKKIMKRLKEIHVWIPGSSC